MRVLITGASGFLGAALAKHLAAAGHEVVALLRANSDERRLLPLPSGVSIVRCADTPSAALAVRDAGADAIIHTVCNYGRNGEPVSAVANVNLGFALAVLEAAVAAGVPRFINSDTVLDRYTNAYSLSKKQFAEWGKWYAEQERIRFTNILLQHMYGPFDEDFKFATYVLRSCHANVESLALSPGEQRRDFIHVEDVVSAYRLLLEAPQDEFWKDVDVGTGNAPVLQSFVRLVHRLTGSRTHLDFGGVPYRPREAMCLVADTTELRRLGWSLRYTLEEGLQQTIDMEFPQ
jgi:nucleoside-diphosphate-sugar epimerase